MTTRVKGLATSGRQLLSQHPGLQRLLVSLGARHAYHAAHELRMLLRYGRAKDVRIDGLQLRFATLDDASRSFFNHPYWFGELFEQNVALHILDRLRSCTCFVDVGANMGFYTIMASKAMPADATVHAVEMDAPNVRRLQASVALNELHNVIVHQTALGDHHGVVEYYECGSEVNTLEVGPDKRHLYRQVSVPMVTLDSLIAQYQLSPEIVKIDVEGAEYLVLLGAQNLLQREHVQIYCEVHLHQGRGSLGAFGHSIDEVFSLLKRHGFQIKQLALRKDSRIEEIEINDPGQLSESVMLYAAK